MKLIVKYVCRIFNPEFEDFCDDTMCEFKKETCHEKYVNLEDIKPKITNIKKFLFYYIRGLGRK